MDRRLGALVRKWNGNGRKKRQGLTQSTQREEHPSKLRVNRGHGEARGILGFGQDHWGGCVVYGHGGDVL